MTGGEACKKCGMPVVAAKCGCMLSYCNPCNLAYRVKRAK